jgi:hypothetical protein
MGARGSGADVALAEWQNAVSANENLARGAHECTIAPATYPRTRAIRHTAGTYQELP